MIAKVANFWKNESVVKIRFLKNLNKYLYNFAAIEIKVSSVLQRSFYLEIILWRFFSLISCFYAQYFR